MGGQQKSCADTHTLKRGPVIKAVAGANKDKLDYKTKMRINKNYVAGLRGMRAGHSPKWKDEKNCRNDGSNWQLKLVRK